MSGSAHFAQKIVITIDTLNEWIGRTISWLTLLMVLVTFSIVILRYALDIGWVAMQELVIYMHVLVFMLGSAYTLKNNGHVRVDIFYQRCKTKTKAWIDFIGTLLLLLPLTGFILWSSMDYVLESWNIHESSRNSGGLPWVYLLKSCIPAMAGLLALQGISLALSNLLIILDKNNSLESGNG